MNKAEPGLLRGILLCLSDSDGVRLQTSRWKRSLLVFSSGVCLEIGGLPYASDWLGYQVTWPTWFLTFFFLPLGVVGLYASKFGSDRFVEWLLVVPKFDVKL